MSIRNLACATLFILGTTVASGAERDTSGKLVIDPAKAELNAQREAAEFGLSREVYNARTHLWKSTCLKNAAAPRKGFGQWLKECKAHVLRTGEVYL